jgi:hypothetical protein
MFKCILLAGWSRPQPFLKFIVAVLLMAPVILGLAQATLAEPGVTTVGLLLSVKSAPPNQVPTTQEPAMTESQAQMDPLDSPYPIPWNWVMKTQEDVNSTTGSGIRYYRSQSLISPDGHYAAYTRLSMQVQPEMYRSRVSSTMFVENLQTGELQVITATSPLADNPLVAAADADMPGTISILIPVSWSAKSDRLLARQFEGLLSTSDASDYAVIWDRQLNRTSTVAPAPAQSNHEIAVLLGWSQTNLEQVLFRAGNLGDEHWHLWAVKSDGQTVAAIKADQPIVFGQRVSPIWGGPQIAYR